MYYNSDDRTLKTLALRKTIIDILIKDNPSLLLEYKIPNSDVTCDAMIKNSLSLDSFKKQKIDAPNIYKDFSLYSNLKSKQTNYYNKITNNKDDCIVLVTTANSRNELHRYLERKSILPRIVILDYSDLIKSIPLKKVLTSIDSYFLDKSNTLIDDTYSMFKHNKGNLSLAIGAGCSISSNISNWSELSKTLGFELLYNITKTSDPLYKNFVITNDLNTQIFNLFENTSAIDSILSWFLSSRNNTFEYYNAIKRVLYMSYSGPNNANTPIMSAIRDCARSGKIKSIINYNFDSVLEQNDNKDYRSSPKEIWDCTTHIGNCPIYHVHGYIPYDYDGKTIINNLVFTDKEYYENLINPNNFTNSTQKQTFKTNNILFIGVSFNDANIKAILRERKIQKSKTNIYCFFKTPSFETSLSNQELVQEKYKFIQQEYFKTFGVNILWVSSYEEIPEKIKSLIIN